MVTIKDRRTLIFDRALAGQHLVRLGAVPFVSSHVSNPPGRGKRGWKMLLKQCLRAWKKVPEPRLDVADEISRAIVRHMPSLKTPAEQPAVEHFTIASPIVGPSDDPHCVERCSPDLPAASCPEPDGQLRHRLHAIAERLHLLEHVFVLVDFDQVPSAAARILEEARPENPCRDLANMYKQLGVDTHPLATKSNEFEMDEKGAKEYVTDVAAEPEIAEVAIGKG